MGGAPTIAPEWRTFEQAVATFLQALDPAASVQHNLHTLDRDTGLMRQRDVWIDIRVLGGFFVLKMLVSCKRKKASLSQQDIDAFVGELRSSGANKGVMFSYRGFTQPALKKAARLGISCCGLFEDRPADLPQVLMFSGYIFRERVSFELHGATYAEVAQGLEPPNGLDADGRSVLSDLIAHYESQRPTVQSVIDAEPVSWGSEVTFSHESDPPVVIRLRSGWEIYRARREACLLNGAYSFTDETFAGGMSMPWIDMWSDHPGPGWDLITFADIEGSRPQVAFVSFCDNLDAALRARVAKMVGEAEAVAPPGAGASA